MQSEHPLTNLVVSEYRPSLLERWGVRYFDYLGKKFGTAELQNLTIDELPADAVLQSLSANITGFAAIVAFGVGSLTTFVTVWIEWHYKSVLPSTEYYTLYLCVLAFMLIIEFSVLFWLGLRTVYSLSCLTGHHQSSMDSLLPVEYATSTMLARAAMELPDPVVHYLGIDPLKHLSKSKLFMVAALYKVKVVLSSLMARIILTDTFGKGGSRTAFSWIAIPITGFWDAFTLYKVAKEARLRLFGHKLAEYLAQQILTDELMGSLSVQAREGAVRAVATMMVLAQNYHPNMLVLLTRISATFDMDNHSEYDDWDRFLKILNTVEAHERYFLLDLLCVSSAFDGKLSRLEKYHLPEAYQELTDIYMERAQQLTAMLIDGRIHAAKALCTLDFYPG
ncbi:MAG: hypothetical protein WCG11_07485 [Methylococcaceae bacterium]